MLRTTGWILWMFGFMLSCIPVNMRAKRLSTKGQEEEAAALVSDVVARWAKTLLKKIGITLQLHGEDNLPGPGEAAVLVANHQSYLDIPILLSIVSPPPAILAKKELGKIPILGYWIRQLGCVLVNRNDARSGIEAIRQSQTVIMSGKSFAIFPEGTRSKSAGFGEFQAGAVHIATKTGASIAPIFIDGSYMGFEGNGNRLKPANVRVVIMPRVETGELTRSQQKALPALIADTIRRAASAIAPQTQESVS